MPKHNLEIQEISRKGFLHTIWWAVLGSALVVAVAATLGRATINLKGALVDKPDIAIYLLLPDEQITSIQKLRSHNNDTERDYLAETRDGPKYIKLKKGETEWYVESVEELRE